MAGPRGSGRDLPALWAPRSEPAEPSGAGHLRGAPRIGAVRVVWRLREALGYAPGFAAQAWPSPGGGLRKRPGGICLSPPGADRAGVRLRRSYTGL